MKTTITITPCPQKKGKVTFKTFFVKKKENSFNTLQMFEMMTVLATIYEDPSREGEFKEPSLAERRRQQRLEQIKRARRHGKQLTIGIMWQEQQQQKRKTFAKARYYRNLDTIIEESDDDDDERTAAAAAKVVKRDWPKFEFFKKTSYKFPAAALQKATGHGENCAYCRSEFVHRYHYSKAPIYLINCGHILCGHCVSLNSRPIIRNLNFLTRKTVPYVASCGGMACPRCNVEFTWQEIHHFYL